jgi:hypothetical protein
MVVCGLTLALLVARVFANHTQDIFALHDAAALAKAFNGCSYFHGLRCWKISIWIEGTKNRPEKRWVFQRDGFLSATFGGR